LIIAATTGSSTITPSLVWEDVDILQHIISFFGNQQYLFVASINRSFRTAYELAFPTSTDTILNASTEKYAKVCWEDLEYQRVDHQRILSYSAVKNGCKAALEYLKSVNCSFDSRLCTSYAAKTGQLSLLQWLMEFPERCVLSSEVCADAAEHGHLHVLQWLRERKCPWDVSTCAMAAKNGHLELLKWARSKRCPWDAETCEYAAAHRH
jgi:hypothetical protein